MKHLVPGEHTVLVVDPGEGSRAILEGRLKAQGYHVLSTGSPAEAASQALAEPPGAVVARLWMPSISGVQLCHLLKAEAATAHVPVILLGTGYTPRSRFLAEHAGASYVRAGAMGAVLRTIERAIMEAPPGDGFFTMLGNMDVRDRIAAELDRRLFDSMLAAEVRSLAACESFDRLFDQLSQLLCRQCPYGWVALSTASGDRIGVHAHPSGHEAAVAAARAALGLPDAALLAVIDEDARPAAEGDRVRTTVVHVGSTELGTLAIGADLGDPEVVCALELVARELGVPMRVALLVEETRKLALYDPLTSVMNRRAFIGHMSRPEEAHRATTLCMLDIDHFKAVNDSLGHAGGDSVLQAIGRLLGELSRSQGGVPCRWGGEEFLFAVPGRARDGGRALGETIRQRVQKLELVAPDGSLFHVSVSVGVTIGEQGEPLLHVVNRADARMYQAKEAGRNQVMAA